MDRQIWHKVKHTGRLTSPVGHKYNYSITVGDEASLDQVSWLGYGRIGSDGETLCGIIAVRSPAIRNNRVVRSRLTRHP